MRHRELVDDGDTQAGLHQRADRGAESRLDDEIESEVLALEEPAHDAAIGVGRLDADHGVAHHVAGADLLPFRQRVVLRHDADEFPARERQEIHAG